MSPSSNPCAQCPRRLRLIHRSFRVYFNELDSEHRPLAVRWPEEHAPMAALGESASTNWLCFYCVEGTAVRNAA